MWIVTKDVKNEFIIFLLNKDCLEYGCVLATPKKK